MPTTVQHDRGNDQLHLIFRNDRLVVHQEWCAPNAIISLAADRTPLSITILGYYSDPLWLFDPTFVDYFELAEYVEDLRLVHDAFFAPPNYGVKTITVQQPDGSEIVMRPGEAPEVIT